MSTDPDLRLIRIRDQHTINDAIRADVCQLTISGTVDTQPEVIEDYDGEPVCCIVLTRTIDHPESGHWELQHHHIHVRGPIGELYVDTYQPGDRVVVCGTAPHWIPTASASARPGSSPPTSPSSIGSGMGDELLYVIKGTRR